MSDEEQARTLKCGLEIHQRLDTGKLFCRCPGRLAADAKPVATVRRRLHAVKSELGERDAAAQFEQSRGMEYSYEIYENDCLVELDEEPPHEADKEALEAVMLIARSLNAKLLDEAIVMRKQVLDGSCVSGFQRTMLVAVDGYIETNKGRISIPTICLEEESSGIVGRTGGVATYRLDRLGIPLIEIATGPDIVDGEHAKEVAEYIGMLIRLTGKAQRGIGTIRQDVNVSIPEGARVEIKGAQELELVPVLVQNEVKRQENLARIAGLQEKAGTINPLIIDLTDIFSGTQCKFVSKAIAGGQCVLGIKAEGYAGILGTELQPNRRFGTELSDYAKFYGTSGIMHSDEDLVKFGISEAEIAAVRARLECGERDAFVLTAWEQKAAVRALEKVAERMNTHYVPEETRRALPDGTSSFLRPLPGKARLYPETDVRPIRLDQKAYAKLGKIDLEAKKAELEKLLNADLTQKIIRSPHLGLFYEIAEKSGGKVNLVAVAATLTDTLVAMRRDDILVGEDGLNAVLEVYIKGKVSQHAIPEALKLAESNNGAKGAQLEKLLTEKGLAMMGEKELEAAVVENGFNLGKVMGKYRLRVEAGEVKKMIEKLKK